MAELYTYAVSRIHAKEMELINSADMEQLLGCSDYGEAMRYLQGKGYGLGVEYTDFEIMIRDEIGKMWDLIHELIPKPESFEILTRQTDFQNLKAAIKAVFTSEKFDDCLEIGGSIEPNVIVEAVKLKNYTELPNFIAGTAEEAVEIFLKTGDGQECDIAVDRACLETILKEAKESGVDIILSYGELLTALSDIKIAVRSANSGKTKGFVERALADCRSLDTDDLSDAASKSIDEVYNYLEHTDYRDAVDALKVSMSEFEKWSDNRIMEMIRSQKANPFTLAPIFAYVLGKINETKAIRIVLSGKKNDLDMDLIRGRIRDLYV